MKKSTVFISYSRKDDKFAHRLADDLRTAGYSVWVDISGLRGGQEWVHEIDKAVRGCDTFILIISPDSMASRWVSKETLLAISLRKPIVPVMWREAERPVHLVDIQYVDFRGAYDDAMRELYEALLPLERVPTPTPTPASPPLKPTRQPFEPEMILIPAGEFLMGSDPRTDRYARHSEQPQHILYLPDYYIAKTPITNAQYAAFVQAMGHDQPIHWKGRKPPRRKRNHPVVEVNWYDAVFYCRWLSQITGTSYCLPSEAEWEKACRGTDGRIYPWGNWWDAKRCKFGGGATTPVGAYPQEASPYGVLDMTGNVWEWTRSLKKPYPYDPGDGREELESEEVRVVRGASWDVSQDLARCAIRDAGFPGGVNELTSFRVAISSGSR